MGNDEVEIEGVKITDTAGEAAVLVFFPQLQEDDDEGYHWMPFSQCSKMVRTHNHNGDSVTVRRWWARQIGLEV